MSQLVLGTTVIQYDEPCLGLYEQDEQSPGSRGWRRYQRLFVVRGDRPAEFRRDLGASDTFLVTDPDGVQRRIPGLSIPAGFVSPQSGRIEALHTVGELIDIADRHRGGFMTPPEPVVPGDLIGGYHDAQEERRLWRRAQSSFGAAFRRQRNR